MPSPLPDLSAPVWTSQLARLLECASAAIGRLDARVSASSVRSAWFERASWTGFAEARRAQGAEMDEIDVFALACGAFLPDRQRLAFAAGETLALAGWQRRLASRAASHWRELIPYPVDLPDGWRDRPALLRALELVSRHARQERTDAPWLDSPLVLAALGVTKTPLPCLVFADRALRFAPRDQGAIVPRFLKAVTRAAETGLDRLDAAERNRVRAACCIADLTRPGQLPTLVALLQRRPLVSPLGVAQVLGLTKSGSGKLLARAAEARLLVEISGRAAWKLYLTPDLAAAFDYVARPIGRPPTLPDIGPLEAAFLRFDEEMATIDAKLATIGVYVGAKVKASRPASVD